MGHSNFDGAGPFQLNVTCLTTKIIAKNYNLNFNMDDAKNPQPAAEGNKHTKKSYQIAVAEEKRRLLRKLIFMTIVSFGIASVLFLSMYFDIKDGDY
ncbi:hypothetical protein FGO68_gene3178 [Halteria grandinella]|uniref:Transmembrane protein n=1 Tax=Halteria grandinella TaxID=5974 RepID=A0A8J8NEN0_HALGN|nr:hypothetical protein FGO68_gene3178 [Halteria grandinella]